MNKKQKWRGRDIFLAVTLVIFLAVIIAEGAFLVYATSHKPDKDTPPVVETNEELLSLLGNRNISIEQVDIQEIEKAGPAPEKELVQTEPIEPVTMQPVALKDVYTEKGNTVFFKCYDKGATDYRWEYYDTANMTWRPADNASIHSSPDELGRNVSMLEVSAQDTNNGMMVRCTIINQKEEAATQTATLYVIDKIKSISCSDIEAPPNKYLGTEELPVTVMYENGKEETITGLNGLYFIHLEENTDYGADVSGNQIETTTITKTECIYHKVETAEEETFLRYRPDTGKKIDTSCKITGIDTEPPAIFDVKTSPYEISNIDKPVNLIISITAEDDSTPFPELEYAFLFQDEELSDTVWRDNPSFEVCIERNGIYSAYVRDRSGNISKHDIEIITVDTKAPVISSVSLSNSEGWCQNNIISVSAKDAGEISYCFENSSDGTCSGWITYSDYTAASNGTWLIKAKDAVGNVSETEITISNIDNEVPAIKKISVK